MGNKEDRHQEKKTDSSQHEEPVKKPKVNNASGKISHNSKSMRADLSINVVPETIHIPGTAYANWMNIPVQFSAWTDLNLGTIPLQSSVVFEVEDDINKLRQENRKLMEELEQKRGAVEVQQETIDKLQLNQDELSRQLRLQHLFFRVHPHAWELLKKDEKFRELFEQKIPLPALVMSVDIRRSTELMLKAKDPESYQSFIIGLCDKLKQIVLDNYGVFDKFTGDGILAFFPKFYSGDDAPYFAVKAADECHRCFSLHYQDNRGNFTLVLNDVGLGIGIDYGDIHLVSSADSLTVIGSPVVYACRLSGAEAGQTLINQQAYNIISEQFGGYVHLQETVIDIKHEGKVLAYQASLSKNIRKIKLPDWESKLSATQ
ncbi:MAG: adenylate/guanylate cyclase domain-containing protein [Dehalococcoidia bacterium]